MDRPKALTTPKPQQPSTRSRARDRSLLPTQPGHSLPTKRRTSYKTPTSGKQKVKPNKNSSTSYSAILNSILSTVANTTAPAKVPKEPAPQPQTNYPVEICTPIKKHQPCDRESTKPRKFAKAGKPHSSTKHSALKSSKSIQLLKSVGFNDHGLRQSGINPISASIKTARSQYLDIPVRQQRSSRQLASKSEACVKTARKKHRRGRHTCQTANLGVMLQFAKSEKAETSRWKRLGSVPAPRQLRPRTGSRTSTLSTLSSCSSSSSSSYKANDGSAFNLLDNVKA